MKNNLLFLFLFCHVHLIFGQTHKPFSKLDSLKQELASTNSDTARVLTLEKLMWVAPNAKAAVKYGQQGLALAKRIHYNKGVMVCGNTLGFNLVQMDYYKAITILLETKQLSEKLDNQFELARGLGILGYAYAQFDFQTAIQYFHRCKKLIEKIHMSEDVIPINSAIGFLYKNWGFPDSALVYIEKGHLHEKASKDFNPNYYYMHLGEIYYKKGQKDLAMDYFRNSIAAAPNAQSYDGMAMIYRDRGHLDSAKYYAVKSLRLQQGNNQTKYIIKSADLLFNLYKTSGPAEALKYHLIASAAKDSLF